MHRDTADEIARLRHAAWVAVLNLRRATRPAREQLEADWDVADDSLPIYLREEEQGGKVVRTLMVDGRPFDDYEPDCD